MQSSRHKVQDILGQIKNREHGFLQDEPGSREQLLSLAYMLASALELPSEAIQRMGWAEVCVSSSLKFFRHAANGAQPARTAQCKVAVDVGLFERLGKQGAGGRTANQLAEECGVEMGLMSRLLKHLAAMNVVEEVSPDKYRATSLSEALTEPRSRDGITYINDVPGPSFRQLPSYLRTISYKTPTSLVDGPFQYATRPNCLSLAGCTRTPHTSVSSAAICLASVLAGLAGLMQASTQCLSDLLLHSMRAQARYCSLTPAEGRDMT